MSIAAEPVGAGANRDCRRLALHAVQARTGAFNIERSRARPSNTNFYYAMRFLPALKRRAITDIYAFCRLTDDLVDEAPGPRTAREQLDAWQKELARAIRSGSEAAAVHPVAAAMASACRRFSIDPDLPAQLIGGCRMDIDPPRIRTSDELDRYC